ncbi:MAG TPA: hypothetical protein VED40_12730 [Azospirillaceae bacterium]|nr:hypothetical protein [Azospirillaceae bacterium]
MIIDMRTRLPHGHLANHGADMHHHARQLRNCAEALRGALDALKAIDVQGFVRAVETERR